MNFRVLIFALAWVFQCSIQATTLYADWQLDFFYRIFLNKPPSWMQEQITHDLTPFFGKKITKEMINQTIAEDKGNLLFVKYKIKNNEIEVTSNAPIWTPYRLEVTTNALKSLAKIITLPNTTFIVCLHDSLERNKTKDLKAPVFVFATNQNKDLNCILMPDFEALSGNFMFRSQVQEGNALFPWEVKKNMAFWRGSTTGMAEEDFTVENFLSFPRSQLVTQSLNYPELIDARYSSICQTSSAEEIKNIFGDYFGLNFSVKDHMQYKYQILIDGNSCSYSRAYWELFSNCVIFKQTSDNVQWYYRGLEPYKHYIPVNNDMSDLADKINWAQENDFYAMEISKNANEFANDNLLHADIMYYLYFLIKEYSKLTN